VWKPVLAAVRAQAPPDLEAVDAGQADVQHDPVIGRRGRHPQRILPPVGDVDREPGLPQRPRDQRRELLLVLDHQDAHGQSP
jgi:hypothetical protein